MSARQELITMIEREDSFDLPLSLLQPLRLEAARELFQERREQVPILQRRAEDSGIKEIRSFDDIVPLLFAHTVYKSYPASLLEMAAGIACCNGSIPFRLRT